MNNSKSNYLFAHFTGESEEGEQIYFSISRDGLHWTDLNGGEPVLISDIGEKGVRDPFLVRDENAGKFYIIATDLRIASGKGWGQAQYDASRDLILWESDDLVNWSSPWSVTVGVPDAGCVWAPESIYDEARQAHMVFWASMTPKNNGEIAKQKIYRAYTKDFKTFTETELYIQRDNHVIDTDIIRIDNTTASKEGYIRFSKDETTKNIRMDFGKTLDKNAFSDVSSPVLDKLFGVEGPICFFIEQSQEWCLMVDQFAEGKGYLPLLSSDVASGSFRILSSSEYDLGKTLKRHGGILPITDAEYDLLLSKYDKQ